MQVLAERYLEKPTHRKEEQMLVLLNDAMKKRCGRLCNQWPQDEFEDLMQVARMAVVRSLRSWVPKKSSFSAWSSRCIGGDFSDHWKSNRGGLIRIPAKADKSIKFAYDRLDDLMYKLAQEESREEEACRSSLW